MFYAIVSFDFSIFYIFYRYLTVMCLKTHTDLRLLFIHYKYLSHRCTTYTITLFTLNAFLLSVVILNANLDAVIFA